MAHHLPHYARTAPVPGLTRAAAFTRTVYYDPRGHEIGCEGGPVFDPPFDPPLGHPRPAWGSASRKEGGSASRDYLCNSSTSGRDYGSNSAELDEDGSGVGESPEGELKNDAERLDEALEMNVKLEDELQTLINERDKAQAGEMAAIEAQKAAENLLAAAEKKAKDLQGDLDVACDELDELRRKVRRACGLFSAQDRLASE
eukprot:TRINITY_DN12407_c0_g1_i5.p1 TRINITY_DN12407_c0_g1~~TRINITY_DN12407_c0_g1_i5.p1  ORF type:complete len:201 (+),score=51.73 TRINITY_DN12407_c0_g1_i5:226-828(+)